MDRAKLGFFLLTLQSYVSPSLEKVSGREVVMFRCLRSPLRNAKTSQV